MYNVLIVDDDALIRNGLAALIDWEALDTTVCAVVSNAQAALAAVAAGKADILITDICMPGKTGLELMRTARLHRPNLKCIVISSYSDFSYVKEAARLGIENYILKPIDDQELTNTIAATVEKLDTETHRRQLEEDGLDVLRSNILSRLLYGEIDEFELRDKAEFIRFNLHARGYGLCCAQIRMTGGFDRESLRLLREEFRKLQGVDCFVFRDPEDHVVTVFSGGAISDDAEALRAKIENCVGELGRRLGFSAALAFSEPAANYKQLPACYAQACAQLRGTPASAGSAVVQKVQEYLTVHYADDINLKVVANQYRMNAFYLGRLFREATGSTFTESLNDLRISHAKELLSSGRYKANEAAQEVGYSNPNYFYTVFKKKTGMSPAAYCGHAGAGQETNP